MPTEKQKELKIGSIRKSANLTNGGRDHHLVDQKNQDARHVELPQFLLRLTLDGQHTFQRGQLGRPLQ